MKKFLKIAAVLVALFFVAALVAPMAFRGKAEQLVKQQANALLKARLDFERLDISLLRHFPHASVELKGLTLVGTEAFDGDTIAAVDRISVVVDLLSLFGDGGFEVTKVILAHPQLHARKLADGSVNWDVMKPAEEPEPAEEPADDTPSSFRLSVKEFRISEAELTYADDSTRMRFSTSPADLRLRGDLSADETALDLRLTADAMRLASGDLALLSGARAELDASIRADLRNRRFAFDHNTLRLNAIELSLDGFVQLGDEAVRIDLTAGCEKVRLKELLSMIPAFYTRDFKSLTASGELSLAMRAKGELTAQALPAFDVALGVDKGSFRYAALPEAVTDIRIEAKVSNPGGPMDATVVDIPAFGFTMAGNSLAASLYATTLASDPTFRASAAGRFDLGAIKKVYPLEKGDELSGAITADVKVSGRMSDIENKRYEKLGASGRFVVEEVLARLSGLPDVRIRRLAATITPAAMTLGECNVAVGRSDLAANGQLTDYLGYLLRGDELAGRLYVKSELLDLNELMAAVPSGGDAPEQAQEQAPAATTGSVLEIPRNLRLSLNTELNRILFQQMTVADLTGGMSLAEGTLRLDKLRMQLFGGKASASGSYSTADDAQRPAVKLNAAFENASFARTFEELETVRKLVPLFEKTGGDYSMTLALDTRLDSAMQPEWPTLNAQGELRSENIRIQQIEAFDALAKALGNDALRNIEARDVAIRFTVRDGRIATQPFDLNMGDIAVRLSGSTGLDQTIDYTARVTLPAAATGGVLSAINVGIGGTFSSPKITLGMKEAAREAATNLVNEQLQKLTGDATVDETIRKQADALRAEAQKAGEKLVEAARAQRQKLIDGAKNPLGKIAAEKAGDALVKEAEKQAAGLAAEAEKQIEKLTAKAQSN